MQTATERPKPDLVTWAFFSLVALSAILYVSLGLTPSSYGLVLQQIHAEDAGPILGAPRTIRSDEWGLLTPLFQAAVRNDFREVNETSFYHEDLRTVFPIPLRNWSMVFRPQFWAFFLIPPATAFSIYFAFFFCAFLTGCNLLFRELGSDPWVAATVSVAIFFSAFIQFWGLWTIAGIPWLLLVLLKPFPWWRKTLLLVWLLPATVLAQPYPPLFIDLGLATLVLLLAFRGDWFRNPRELAAASIGGLFTIGVLYAYFGKLIPIMANTVYPGHRLAPPGTVPIPVALTNLFPFLTMDLSNFQPFTGVNLVENGTIASFFLILTMCLARYRDLWNNHRVRLALVTLLSAATLMILWQVAPMPHWIGRIFRWDIAAPERLSPAIGLLLILAAIAVWSHQLISVHPARLGLFLLAGPIASLDLKLVLFKLSASACKHDLAICGLAIFACLVAFYFRPAHRAAVLLTLVAIINLVEIGRFTPFQPAAPIFDVPDTGITQYLRLGEGPPPDRIVLDERFYGMTLNGMGFRSVTHVLPTPQLAFFRKYFPTMDAERFNTVFNRYAHIQISDDPLPFNPFYDFIRLPRAVFEPIRNSRQASFGGACKGPSGGAIEHTTAQGALIDIEGWAPWKSENDTQGIRVLSARRLRAETLLTLQRPDIGESRQDYGYAKAGFHLRLSSLDGQPVRPEEVALVATGTVQGDVQLSSHACPMPHSF